MAVHIPACGRSFGDLLSKNVHLNLGDGKAGSDAWKDTLTTLVGEDGPSPPVSQPFLAGEDEVFPAAEGAAATAMASYIDKAVNSWPRQMEPRSRWEW